MKVIRLAHGQGVVRNTGNYESVRIYNEVETIINDGATVKKVHALLKRQVEKLNRHDLNEVLKTIKKDKSFKTKTYKQPWGLPKKRRRNNESIPRLVYNK